MATYDEKRLYEEISELRALLTTTRKELAQEREEAVAREVAHGAEVERLTRERDEVRSGIELLREENARDLARQRDDLTAPCHGLGCGRCVECCDALRREQDKARDAVDDARDHEKNLNARLCAAEQRVRALREALEEAEHCLVPATKKLIEVGFWPHEPHALGAVRSALAAAPGAWLAEYTERVAQVQVDICTNAVIGDLKSDPARACSMARLVTPEEVRRG